MLHINKCSPNFVIEPLMNKAILWQSDLKQFHYTEEKATFEQLKTLETFLNFTERLELLDQFVCLIQLVDLILRL